MAGIDVFSKEPATNHALLDLNNVTTTPHLGANTKESQKNISIQAAQQALNAIRGISYPNALNLPIDNSENSNFVKPYLELSQKIGFLCSQIQKSPIKSITVLAEGEISDYIESILTFAIVGTLKSSLMEKINYVNAKHIAKQREIKLDTKKSINSSSPYKNKIALKLITDSGQIQICGTIFDDNIQKIVKIDDFSLEISPKGKMIFFKNSDIPGVIGDIGSLLAKNNINISDFRLGRNNNEALAIIVVDDEISKPVLEQLSKLKACINTSYAKF
jgi:D-3-phosphoglycerate dehydrogenase